MAITKQKKGEMVEKMSGILKDSVSVVFVNFHGLSVTDTTAMRSDLRKSGIGYLVTKKTLAKRALAASGVLGDLPNLEGELAFAYGADPLAPAREVYSFEKKYKENFSILGGIFEGRYMNKGDMTSLATIPPMQVLRGQFVRLINSPIQRMAVVMAEIAKKQA